MTAERMADILTKYCASCKRCDYCELKKLYDAKVDKYTDDYGCNFKDMDEQMVDKIYGWYKELNPATCENAKAKEPDVDMVNHPSHYTQGGIECIDCIKSATVGKVGIEAFCVGNAIKYLFRYEEKNGIEDVKKARWYIDRLIRELEEKE